MLIIKRQKKVGAKGLKDLFTPVWSEIYHFLSGIWNLQLVFYTKFTNIRSFTNKFGGFPIAF